MPAHAMQVLGWVTRAGLFSILRHLAQSSARRCPGEAREAWRGLTTPVTRPGPRTAHLSRRDEMDAGIRSKIQDRSVLLSSMSLAGLPVFYAYDR